MIIEAFIELVSIELQAFSSNEILDMIDPVDLAKIKESDPHPFFKAWVVAQEGISTPRFVGRTKPVKISWPKKAIQATAGFIKKGIKFFQGHNKDNSTDGRPYLGEIVASKIMEIEGKLSSVVVGYFPGENIEQVKKQNVCSMEAIWNLAKTAAGYVSEGIKKLTGIALGNGNFDKPAFAGAGELAQVQAFEDTKINKENKEMSDITYGMVESFVKDPRNNVKPSQFFTWEQIQADRVFLPNFKEIESREKELSDSLEKAKGETEKLQEENQKNVLLLQKTTVKPRLEKMLEGKEDDLKKFILKKSDAWDNLSDEFITKQIAAIEEDYKFFKAGEPDDTQLPPPGTPPGKNPPDDANDPDKNPALNWNPGI